MQARPGCVPGSRRGRDADYEPQARRSAGLLHEDDRGLSPEAERNRSPGSARLRRGKPGRSRFSRCVTSQNGREMARGSTGTCVRIAAGSARSGQMQWLRPQALLADRRDDAGARAAHAGFGSVEALALRGVRISGFCAVFDCSAQRAAVSGGPLAAGQATIGAVGMPRNAWSSASDRISACRI
jgi:hypothetical protein